MSKICRIFAAEFKNSKTMSKSKSTKIRLDRRNYRKHGEENKRIIKKSLEELGAGRSIVIDAEGEIIAGNGVFEQAQELGIKTKIVETDGSELVVVKRTDLATGDEKRRKLALADNVASDLSEWDDDALRDDWTKEEMADWGLELPDEIEEAETGKAKEDNFDETKEEIEARVQKGQVWQLGEHRLMCGDSTNASDVALLMDGARSALCITDPPYGVSIGDRNAMLNKHNGTHSIERNIANDTLPTEELHKLLTKAMINCRKNSEIFASYYVFSPQGGDLGMMMMMKDAGLPVRHMLVWVKNAAAFSMGRLDYDYKHEPILYTWTKSHKFYGRDYNTSVFEDMTDVDKMKKNELLQLVKEMMSDKYPTSVIKENKPLRNNLHPTMKPIALIARLMINSSRQDDVILDLFGGSGSTLIAAEQLKRKCYMMELDAHYCDVIITRWEKLTGRTAKKIQ